MKLSQLLQKLPIEIIRENILPFSYSPQNIHLLDDIESFVSSRDYLIDLYSNSWANINHNLFWLSNDISRFLNDNISSSNGFSLNNIDKWRRLYMFRDKSDYVIISFLSNYSKRKSIVDINISLGILTPHERTRLIDFLLNI